MGKIRSIQQARPDQALDNLNRLTGLNFTSWPESLVSPATGQKEAGPEGRRQAQRKVSGGLIPSSR